MKYEFEVVDIADSTNTLLKNRAKFEDEGKVLIANTQTSGRGRLGRSFYSPAGSGLYMSLLLKPRIAPTESLLITTCAAVAVCEAIEAMSGKKAGIKWVNDVFVGGKKVCGILTESGITDGKLDYAVLGIGVNLYDCGFPDSLKDIAGAVFDGKPCSCDVRDKMAKEICERFFAYYENLCEKRFLGEYRRRSIVTGKTVNVISGGNTREAKVLDIDDDLALLVEFPDGTRERLLSGEVSIRIK